MASKREVMKYDPIMCMMVPKKADDAKTWVVEYEDALGDDHKKTFADKTAVEKFIRRGTDVGRAYHLKVNGKAVNNMSTWTADAEVNGKEANWITIKGHKVAIGEGGNVVAGGVPGTNIGKNNSKTSKSKEEKNENGHTISQWFKRNLSDLEDSLSDYPPSEMEEKDYSEYLKEAGFSVNKENIEKCKEEYKKAYNKISKSNDSVTMIYDEVMAMMKPATAKDKRTIDFSSGDAKKVFDYIDRQVTKDMNEYPREIERAKTPDDCERLNNAIRSSLDNAVDEYIQIWNEVGLYAQKRKNEIVDRYGKLMSQAFKKYNELKSRE